MSGHPGERPGAFSFATTYDCPACHASCPATVTGLADPVASIAPRTQDTMRKTRALLVQVGRREEGDPVDEIAAEVLEQEARSTLLYATCPRCAARNPEGVAERAADARRWRWITAAILVALAASAWFVRWVAVAMPGLNLLAFRPMAILHARRSGVRVRWLVFASSVAVDVACIALVVLVPRAAPLVLLAPAVQVLVRRPAPDEWRWSNAAEKIRFEGG